MKRVFTCLLAIALSPWAFPVAAVTDCSKAKTNIDWLMCSSDKVTVAEQLMAEAFRGAYYRTKDKEALVKEQDEWRKNVRDACNDVPCLLDAYRRRTSELETY